jgi:hypothetical protein
MGHLNLCLSFANWFENVDLRRAARRRRPCQRDILESDCRGRDLRVAVISPTDSSEGYLDLLAHCSGHVLPIVCEIEGQRLWPSARRGCVDLLTSAFPQGVGNKASATRKTVDCEFVMVSSSA